MQLHSTLHFINNFSAFVFTIQTPPSGESAKGKYPVQSILMMDKILEQTEQFGNTRDQPVDVKPSGLCPDEGMAYVSVAALIDCLTA